MIHEMRIVPFKRWHLAWLEVDGSAAGGNGPKLDDLTLEYLERYGSWTAVCDGRPMVCAGFIEQWPGRTIAWAYLNKNSAQHMLFITRRVREALAKVKGRIEITVRCDFPAGNRWAQLLDFSAETPILKAYGPEGEDHVGYVRYN